MKGKKAEIVSNKTVAIIIAVLILASVGVFLFKTDINTYLRNVLPGYHYDESGKDVDYTAKDGQIASNCNYKVAKIVGTNIYFCNNGNCDGSEKESILYIEGTRQSGAIKIKEVWWKFNPTVGNIKNGFVILENDLINPSYNKDIASKIGVEHNTLVLLDDAFIYFNGANNFFCKKLSAQDDLSSLGINTSQVNDVNPPDMNLIFSNRITAEFACSQFFVHHPEFEAQNVKVYYQKSPEEIIESDCVTIFSDPL